MSTRLFSVVAILAIAMAGLSSCSNTLLDVPKDAKIESGSGGKNTATPVFRAPVSGDSWVTLSWSTVDAANTYNLYYGQTSAAARPGSTSKVTGIQGTSVTLVKSGTTVATLGGVGTVGSGSLALQNGATYYFVVTAVGSDESLPATFVSAAPNRDTGMAPPVLNPGVAGDHSVTLSWGTVKDAATYNVYYASTEPGAVGTSLNRVSGVVGTTVTLTTVGTSVAASSGVVADGSQALVNGTATYFVVSATGSGGEGAVSLSPVAVTPQVATTAPGAVTSLTATPGPSSVNLSWTAVTGASSYNVFYASTSSGVTTTSVNSVKGITATSTRLATSGTSIASSGIGGTVNPGSIALENGTAYYFAVQAVNDIGGSALSTVASATPTLLVGGSVQKTLDVQGTVSLVVGRVGYTTEKDGDSTTAVLYYPYGVTTDGERLFTMSPNRIRVVDIATSTVTSIVSSGLGIGSETGHITYHNGYLYFTTGNEVRRVNVATGVFEALAGSSEYSAVPVDGKGNLARFYSPRGITNDGVNLYVVDTSNSAIRKVVIATGEVTTLAGSTERDTGSADGVGTAARFKYPEAITTDGRYLYVDDDGNGTIRRIEIATATVTTLLGSVAELGDLCTDGAFLYYTEEDNHVVRKVSLAQPKVELVAGQSGTSGNADGYQTSATFKTPWGITTDGKALFVTQHGYDAYLIRKIE